MQIRTEVADGFTVVYPEGALDIGAAPIVRERLNTLVQEGKTRLVIDLSAVEAVDSTGLGAMISGLKAARKNGGDLQIVNPNASVTKLLELTSLDYVLKTYEPPDGQ